MAQKYVDDLSRNVRRGLKTKAEMGWIPGKLPPGYVNRKQPDGRKTVAKDPRRFPIIRKCWELMLAGGHNPSEIRDFANTVLGYRNKHGLPMSRNTIYKMFRSPLYAGTFEFPKGSGIWHTGRHVPMVTQDEFQEVQKLLNGSRSRTPLNRKTFAYTGIIRCGTCNGFITAEERHQMICPTCKFKFAYRRKSHCPKCRTALPRTKGKHVRTYTYYHCTGRTARMCNERSIRLEELTDQICRLIDNICVIPAYQQWLLKRAGCVNTEQLLSRMRKTARNGTPSQQRSVILSFASNMRMKDRHISCDLTQPFR